MTLAQAVTRLATRFGVDLDAEIDTADTGAMTTAIMNAANLVARDTYFLWTWKSELTLTDTEADYSTLDPTVSEQPVFHIYHVHINGGYLEYYDPAKFFENFPNFYNASPTSKPTCYTLSAPSNLRLATPADSTAAAASDNFIAGFRLHTPYTYGVDPGQHSNVELEGPAEFHQLIVNRAALDNSVSYVSGQEGFTRRQMIEAKYEKSAKDYKTHNLSLYKPLRREGRALGSTRRIFSVTGWG